MSPLVPVRAGTTPGSIGYRAGMRRAGGHRLHRLPARRRGRGGPAAGGAAHRHRLRAGRAGGLDVTPGRRGPRAGRAPGRGHHLPTRRRPSSPGVPASCFDDGATGVVSVHLSARLSGTYESARLAAEEFGGRVAVVDSGSAGMGVGFVALRRARRPRPPGETSPRYGRRPARRGRTDEHPVLRRHARVPAPRRPDRGRVRPCSARPWR